MEAAPSATTGTASVVAMIAPTETRTADAGTAAGAAIATHRAGGIRLAAMLGATRVGAGAEAEIRADTHVVTETETTTEGAAAVAARVPAHLTATTGRMETIAVTAIGIATNTDAAGTMTAVAAPAAPLAGTVPHPP